MMSYQSVLDLHVIIMRVDSQPFRPICDFPYRAFLRLLFGRDADMCDLSNAEVFNRWVHCKKQTAKDYWYTFLKSRADRSYPGAQEYVDKMNFFK